MATLNRSGKAAFDLILGRKIYPRSGNYPLRQLNSAAEQRRLIRAC